MKSRKLRFARNLVAALILLLAACWIMPSFFNAERYRHSLEAGLERALERRVTFGAVSYRLLPRPGFSIENAVVHEDPAFGAEPLARVDRIDCNLRWRSLLRSRFEFSRLYLDHPSFNLVRNANGQWNVESFLRKSGLASPPRPAESASVPGDSLDLSAEDARIDFSVESVKKPFTLTDVTAHVNFNRQKGLLSFRLEGSPIRTDLSLPSPGVVQLEGQWTPGRDLEGPLDAELRTQGAMLYDWAPMVSGRNPEIYGILDAQIHITGSLHQLNLEGQTNVSQLHRTEQLPPSEDLPFAIFFRGHFDRIQGEAVVDGLDSTFAGSRVHLTGSIKNIPTDPGLDLVMAVERSRLEDFFALEKRLTGSKQPMQMTGRVDSLLTIQGNWRERRFAGFGSGRNLTLTTPSGSFPVSDVDVQIADNDAHVPPVKITLAPNVALTVEAEVGRIAPPVSTGKKSGKTQPNAEEVPARFQITMAAKSAPVHNIVHFMRSVGVLSADGLDARGTAAGTVTLEGPLWPSGHPRVDALVDLNSASLLVPGFTEPLNIPRAHIQVAASRVVADPVVAVIGTNVFSGRIEHAGAASEPWQFDIHTGTLSLEEASLWFGVLGRRQSTSLLEHLPGFSSFGEVRNAASNLFKSLNARGNFSSGSVTYHAMNLTDFRTSVDISGRTIKLDGASFRAAGGKGDGKMMVDFTSSPARVSMDLGMTDGSLQSLASRLPLEIRKVRGAFSGTGHFETRGLSHAEITDNLQGSATVRLKEITMGGYDPLQALARHKGWGNLEPTRGQVEIRSCVASIEVHDRRVVLGNAPVAISGAQLKLTGAYAFDGAVDLDVHADMRRLTRHWLNSEGIANPSAHVIEFHLFGPLDKLAAAPEFATSQPNQ